jgi:murein DD-endopeptidase MepM/ murein hydrolase activator NlpD
MKAEMYRPNENLPAWLPRLDARSLQRRAYTGGLAVFSISALLSYALFAAPPLPTDGSAPVQAALLPQPSLPIPALKQVAVIEPEIAPALEPDPSTGASTLRVITGRIAHGDTVSGTLRAQGVEPARVHQIAANLRPIFNFRHAHEGDFYALIENSEGQLLSFEFQRGRSDIYRLERTPEGEISASHTEAPLERRVLQLAGIVETSLFDAILALGEGPELVHEFADMFVWDFDFGRQTRPGDEFRLTFEKYYDRDGFVRYGAVLAGQYKAAKKDMTAVYFEDDDGYGDYYSPDGNSVRRSFLRAPLRYSRISSRYTNARLHPILKVRRPHRGIDYAAPTGTQVWTVADGEVIHKGWSGGFGRLVKVRHNNGYISFYGHLSRYGKGLKVGDHVRQKQVIGYVGSSGLATGPHLDYRLRVGGRFVDPLRAKFPTGKPIPVKSKEHFDEIKQVRLKELNGASAGLVLEAAM